MTSGPEIPTQTLAESENFHIWASAEPDGETVYHIDVGAVTLHLFQEEFDDLLTLIRGIKA